MAFVVVYAAASARCDRESVIRRSSKPLPCSTLLFSSSPERAEPFRSEPSVRGSTSLIGRLIIRWTDC